MARCGSVRGIRQARLRSTLPVTRSLRWRQKCRRCAMDDASASSPNALPCDKKVSGTFCEELALRVLRTTGTRHLLIAHCLVALWSAVKASTGYAFPVAGTEICFTQRVADSTIALHRL